MIAANGAWLIATKAFNAKVTNYEKLEKLQPLCAPSLHAKSRPRLILHGTTSLGQLATKARSLPIITT